MRRLVNPDRARGQADISAAAASRSVGDNAARGEAARGAQSSVRRGPSHGTHKFSASCILLTHRAGRHRRRYGTGTGTSTGGEGAGAAGASLRGAGAAGGPGGKAKGAPSRASAQRDGGRLQRGGHGRGCRPPWGAAPRPRGSRGGSGRGCVGSSPPGRRGVSPRTGERG